MKVLFVGAHPDDIEINAGGSMHRLGKEGHDIYAAVLSGFHVHPKEPDRETEGRKAFDILGAKSTFFDGRDTMINEGTSHSIRSLEHLIKHWQIDTVFTHHFADTHQDHVAAHQITMAAARKVDNIYLYRPVYPSGRTNIPCRPNMLVCLTEEAITAKLSALAEHKSQIVKYGSEDWLDSIKMLARSDAWIYGGSHGYAEVFEVSRVRL